MFKVVKFTFNWQLGPGELYLVHPEASLSQFYINHCMSTVVIVNLRLTASLALGKLYLVHPITALHQPLCDDYCDGGNLKIIFCMYVVFIYIFKWKNKFKFSK